jgi:hypothetical protein
VQQPGGSPVTLVIASISSAAAAVVVRALWAPGTIAGAALMPLLVTLFGELLHRPAHRLSAVARQRLRAGTSADPGVLERMLRKHARWRRVGGTAAAAFLIGSGALTCWEVILHHSVANANDRTTLWGGEVRPQLAPTGPRRTTRPPVAHAPFPRTSVVTPHRSRARRPRPTVKPTRSTPATTTSAVSQTGTTGTTAMPPTSTTTSTTTSTVTTTTPTTLPLLPPP